MQLGVTAVGLVVFQNNARINTFSWLGLVTRNVLLDCYQCNVNTNIRSSSRRSADTENPTLESNIKS